MDPPGLAADLGNARTRKAWLCFLDESSVSLIPPTRRTWAPRGKTPILRYQFGHRPKASMAGVICYQLDGSAAKACYGLLEGSCTDRALIGLLGRLGRTLHGDPAILIWDNLPSHHSRRMRTWIAGQDWLVVEYLPPYAPELNPVEGMWSSVKARELANLGAKTMDGVTRAARRGLRRIQRAPELLLGFLGQGGLSLNQPASTN
jgi:transposase